MQRVKYDKIQHVRHAVGRALAQLAAAGPAALAAAAPNPKILPLRGVSAASSGASSASSAVASLEKQPPTDAPTRSSKCAHSSSRLCISIFYSYQIYVRCMPAKYGAGNATFTPLCTHLQLEHSSQRSALQLSELRVALDSTGVGRVLRVKP